MKELLKSFISNKLAVVASNKLKSIAVAAVIVAVAGAGTAVVAYNHSKSAPASPTQTVAATKINKPDVNNTADNVANNKSADNSANTTANSEVNNATQSSKSEVNNTSASNLASSDNKNSSGNTNKDKGTDSGQADSSQPKQSQQQPTPSSPTSQPTPTPQPAPQQPARAVGIDDSQTDSVNVQLGTTRTLDGQVQYMGFNKEQCIQTAKNLATGGQPCITPWTCKERNYKYIDSSINTVDGIVTSDGHFPNIKNAADGYYYTVVMWTGSKYVTKFITIELMGM